MSTPHTTSIMHQHTPTATTVKPHNHHHPTPLPRRGLSKLVPYHHDGRANWRFVWLWKRIFSFAWASKKDRQTRETCRTLCQLFRDTIPAPPPYICVPSQCPTIALALLQVQRQRHSGTIFIRAKEDGTHQPCTECNLSSDGTTYDVTFACPFLVDTSGNIPVDTLKNVDKTNISFPGDLSYGSHLIREIRVAPGVFTGDLQLSTPDLTITGSGIQQTIIRGTVLMTTGAKNINCCDLTIDGSDNFDNGFWDPAGNSHAGLGVDKGAQVVIEDCEIVRSGGAGCGVVDSESSLVLNRCHVHRCRRAGIVSCDNALLFVNDCKSCDNGLHGLDVNTGSSATIINTMMNSNKKLGAVVWGKDTICRMRNCTAENNKNENFYVLDHGTLVCPEVTGREECTAFKK